MLNFKAPFLAVAALCLLVLPAKAEEAPQSRYVNIELSAAKGLSAGAEIPVIITQHIANGWHTYWKNPGDSGEAMRVKWGLPQNFSMAELQWPAPHRMPMGPLMNFGYDREANFITTLKIPENFTDTTATIKGEFEWLVCADICVPEKQEVTLTLNADPSIGAAETLNKAQAAMPQSGAAWVGMIEEKDELLTLTLTPDDIRTIEGAKDFEFYPEEWGLIDYPSLQKTVSTNPLKIELVKGNRPLSEIQSLPAIIAFEDGNGTRRAYDILVPITSGAAHTDDTAVTHTESADLSFISAVFFALIGGLILNLMPCVFPVLSMKALSLSRLSDKEVHEARAQGVFYQLGILTCFAAIAALLLVLKSGGAQIGWGFHLQQPAVVLVLAYLLFLMGLSLSGLFEIGGANLTNIGSSLTRKKGHWGSFFTGMLATIVATPCTAPFMAGALGYALVQPPAIAFIIFMALGLGLGLPYLVLCFIPQTRHFIPRPGAWMETFKEFLAFPMYASVAWLLWVYSQQTGTYGVLLGGIGIVFVAFSVWLFKHKARSKTGKTVIRFIAILFAVLSLSIAALNAMPALEVSEDEAENAEESVSSLPPATPYSEEALKQALEGDSGVFVNMTAAWCITCKVNERVALATEHTREVFAKNNITFIIGDWTNQQPDITAYLAKYGRNGVPLYVYYGARDAKTGKRPEPQILPQLLTPSLVQEAVAGASE